MPQFRAIFQLSRTRGLKHAVSACGLRHARSCCRAAMDEGVGALDRPGGWRSSVAYPWPDRVGAMRRHCAVLPTTLPTTASLSGSGTPSHCSNMCGRLLSPAERANGILADPAAPLSRSRDATGFAAFDGVDLFSRPADACDRMSLAVRQYRREDGDFRSNSSRTVMGGGATISAQEIADPAHFEIGPVSAPRSQDSLPPLRGVQVTEAVQCGRTRGPVPQRQFPIAGGCADIPRPARSESRRAVNAKC